MELTTRDEKRLALVDLQKLAEYRNLNPFAVVFKK